MSSKLDLATDMQTLEVLRTLEQAARQADAVIELAQELRQRLGHEVDLAGQTSQGVRFAVTDHAC